MKGKQLAYRPDIDGLRAVAVILVLLFHFDLGVSGGFVGVDVFFVISGYLITEVIRNGIAAGKFTFHDFYARRLLRLHPALLVTVAASLGAGFLLMDPASFSDLAASARYATFSASNFYFWLNQNYFDASAQTKPLLHTWSLAAEWQFYLVWPFVVWGATRISQKALPLILVTLTVGSLVASQWMLGRDSSAAYFMMPFRVFELAIGGLLVFAPEKRLPGPIDSAIALGGILSIVASAVLLTDKTPFPGLAALLPCLGAAASIYAGRSAMSAVLRTSPMVKIGLISYSIYLVHWPIAVFYKYYVFRELVIWDKLALISLAFILGYIQYKFIEKIFISKKKLVTISGLAASVVGSLAISYAGGSIISNSGYPIRVSPQYLEMARDPVKFHRSNYGGQGFTLDQKLGNQNGEELAVIGGDSFALQYASGIDTLLSKEGKFIDGSFQHGCVLSSEYTRMLNNVPRQDCRDTYSSILSKLHNKSIPFIYAQSWDGYRDKIADKSGELVTTRTDQEYVELIFKILDGVRADIGDRPFIVVGSQPYLSMDKSATTCLLRPSYIPQGCEKLLHYRADQAYSFEINQALKKFASQTPNTYYVDAYDELCPGGNCSTVLDGSILYSDATHLSKSGSLIAAKPILDKTADSR